MMPAAASRRFAYCVTRSPMATRETASGWRCSRRPTQRAARPRRRFQTLPTSGMGSPSLLDRLIGGQAELAHLLLQVLAVHADLLGRLGDVAAVAAERLAEEVALEGLHHALLGLAEGRGEGGGGWRPGDGGAAEQVGGRDLGAGREEERLLDRRAQLAHVAPPLVGEAGAQRLAGERLGVAGEAAGGLLQE